MICPGDLVQWRDPYMHGSSTIFFVISVNNRHSNWPASIGILSGAGIYAGILCYLEMELEIISKGVNQDLKGKWTTF
jgi:hypothetical protein